MVHKVKELSVLNISTQLLNINKLYMKICNHCYEAIIEHCFVF